MNDQKRITVMIPTRNAEKYIETLLRSLWQQSWPPDEIIVIDSSSEDRTVMMAKEQGARVVVIPQNQFDHGGTRNLAASQATGDYLFFLTQDALPANRDYIRHMVEYMEQTDVVMTSGRQIARNHATILEKLTRFYNYPSKSFIRSKEDIPRLGIKAYFFSDVCAVYRKSFFEQSGGFEAPVLTNEDMLMASSAFLENRKIGYCAEAMVYHSHHMTLRQLFQRNFDIGVFLKMYENEIASRGTTGEGVRMVRTIIRELLKRGRFLSVLRCILESGAKFLGNRAGKHYLRYSRKQILKRTSNPLYWRNYYADHR